MKKLIFASLVFIALLTTASCRDDNNDEPLPVGDEWIDPIFAQVLQERGYITDAKTVTPIDVADLESIDVSGTYENRGLITSVRGLEQFKSLKEFWCYYNQLTTLDVSHNTQLTHLGCYENQLTALDVSHNTQLTDLRCGANQLTTLDVSHNTQLTYLGCSYNQLTALDISNNQKIEEFSCYGNPGENNKFIVTSWFDSSAVPSDHFTKGSWDYNGNTVTIEYSKVK